MKLTPEELQSMMTRPAIAARNPAKIVGRGTKFCERHQVLQSKCGCGFAKIHPPTCEIPQLKSIPKPLLNKTEAQFKLWLKALGYKTIHAQEITLRLAPGLSYRPDFVTVEPMPKPMPLCSLGLTAWETKAPHRFARAGINKLKMAAAKYPWIRFVLVTRDGSTWTQKEIRSE